MPAIYTRSSYIVTRDDDDSDDDGSNSTINLLVIVLAVIVALGVVLLGALLVLKKARNQRARASTNPPQYNDVVHQDKNHHHLTIDTRSGRTSIVYNKDGKPMLANPNSPPHAQDNVPEIHITFPDEEHEGGRRKSGRVVVVRVGDNAAVGLEPLDEDELPAYEKDSNGSFYSIDMDDIGGLREKEREDYH
ncbi:unnamed protein product [Discula destructiva]